MDDPARSGREDLLDRLARAVEQLQDDRRRDRGEVRAEPGDVGREVTGREANDARLALSEAALEHAGAMAHLGAWWAEYEPGRDPSTIQATWSEEAYRICGYEPGEVEVTGALFLQHVHPDDRGMVQDALARVLSGERHLYAVEHRIVRKDGAVRRVIVHADAGPAADGRILLVGAVQDVTEQRAMEDALREADRRKTEFLAVLSHELRNPLAPIRHCLDLLERTPPGSEVASRALAAIRRQSAHMARLVDDLLDVTRIARGKIQVRREVADLREIVRRASEDHGPLFDQAGVELRLDLPARPVWVEVDAERIAQVAGNLLHNASKFTPARGVVTLFVRAREGRAELRVRDTGIGMAPGRVSQMFEPFEQEERGLPRTRGGIGLGLALAKGLVELHGGTILARSEGRGKGSEFLVRLPLARAPRRAAPQPRAARPPAPAARLRVLVIDDNLDAAQAVADLLELEGHEVLLARDGHSGLAVARERRPDVVVCDIGLPDMDGYAVARALRKEPSLGEARLIAMSGYAQPEDRQRSREAGFDAHLAKPTPLEELDRALSVSPSGVNAREHPGERSVRRE